MYKTRPRQPKMQALFTYVDRIKDLGNVTLADFPRYIYTPPGPESRWLELQF